jgi:hypothetical protein
MIVRITAGETGNIELACGELENLKCRIFYIDIQDSQDKLQRKNLLWLVLLR